MNGNSTGIVPTIDLATNNNAYPYPMMYGNNNGFGYGGDWIWIILLFALFGNGGWGGFGGFGGGFGGMYEFPWLLTGQQGINNNTNQGFDTLQLSNQIEGIRDGVAGLSNQVCNSTASVVQAVNSGFANAEISANARQVADMNQNFNNQIATLNGFNNINNALQNCCCENRLGIANLNSTIISENCADRQALNEGVRDILANQTASVQRILDQLCQDKIDAKNDTIAQLRQELLYARGQASQIEQTAQLRQGQIDEVDALYNRLSNCPVPSTPVYGRTPIFTCNNNGCGCGNNNYLY